MNAIPHTEIAPTQAQFAVRNPATGETIGSLPSFTLDQVAVAAHRAGEAQKKWAATSVRERLKVLKRFGELLCDQKDKVAAVISREAGKPEAEALATEIMVVLDTAKYLRENVAEFLRPEAVPHGNPIMKLKKGVLLREPYGVVGIISPWNYPFSIPAVQSLAALATGNAVVIKPSEFTPYSSLEVGRLMREAGLDPDLLQVITGEGPTGAALLNAPIQKIVFTGSVATGKRVAQAAAARLLPVVLELGGKDPMIVLEDADLDVASSAAVWGAFMNAGQTCLSVERCYVQEKIYEDFLKRCVEKTNKLRIGSSSHPLRQEQPGKDESMPAQRVGHPLQGGGSPAQARVPVPQNHGKSSTAEAAVPQESRDSEIDVGPMIHERQLATVQVHVDDAIARGARLLAGGKTLPEFGPTFFAPTILADVDHTMTIMREETFGPVLPVRSFKSDHDAVALANDSEFGLAASVFTKDRKRGEALARRIDAGTVMVNDMISCFGISEAPHGGVKASGIGRTHGRFGLEEMVWPKYVDSDRMPGMKKPWWYGYGPAFANQMGGFVDLLFARKLTNRVRGALKSTKSYLRRRLL
ncbi:MAG TPA: aldehyde dehydrogenase family protein [Candidatus Angelobacter sp.]|nr:aldehyde dehydrogenase family protein [Candidatus Angelobacter sp.]